MPKWPFKVSSNPAGKALHRIEEARKKGEHDLILSDLKLSVLPEAIVQLTQLQVLDLSDNQLRTLPEANRESTNV
jgi:Leucine-rich repeat (LRR) protein